MSKKIDFDLGKYKILKHLNVSYKDKKLFFIKYSEQKGSAFIY